MRILKWLFHPIILFIIVILVAVYINRYTLFPELSESPEVQKITSRVDSVIDNLNETVSSIAGQDSVENGVVSSAADTMQEPDDTDTDTTTNRNETSPVAAAPTQQASIDDVPEVATDETNTAIQELSPGVTDDEAEPRVATSDDTAKGMPGEPPEKQEGSAGDTAGSALDVWEAARRAAWEGDAEQAVAQYHALIAMQPKNYDAYGELGNVLLRMGDKEAAVDAYYQAAMLLSQSRYPQVAWRVLDIVARLDQQKAQQLYEAMRKQQLGAARPQPSDMN